MERKLSIAEQLDLAEKALFELEKLKERGEYLFMCWIFYDLLGIEDDCVFHIETVHEHIDLFNLTNMREHSKTKSFEFAPYGVFEYVERKKFLKWMITEYKSMLAKN